jgi:hypothetical protein
MIEGPPSCIATRLINDAAVSEPQDNTELAEY